MNKYYSIILLFFLLSCQEIERSIPIDETEAAPESVSDVQIVNIAGGATISYVLPQNDNILYVMAEYFVRGDTFEKKSSFYNNSITLDGFPDANPYNIKLYSVTRSGTKSDPVTVTINPLTPPVISAFNSFKMNPTFGGVKISFENESEANLKMIVLTTDTLGDLYQADTYYTKRKSGNFSVRGFESQERSFGIYTVDRWGNYSDTLFVTLTPWFEEKLNKSRFETVKLPTDTYLPHASETYTPERLWDDVWGTDACFHTKPNTGIPQWFTIDLGVTARLSRFKFYHRKAGNSGANSDGQYSAGDPQILEVYGSNQPDPLGGWDTWELLGNFQSVKPSGSSTWTDEDIQYACEDGEDFEFTTDTPFRYLRFKILKNWGGVSYIYMAELTFWGEIIEVND